MEDEKLFNLMELMYAEMQKGFKEVNERIGGLEGEVGGLKGEVSGLKERVSSLENTVTRIEHDHGKKLDALFDGYKQNTEQLEAIKQEVGKHEEFIIKRVK